MVGLIGLVIGFEVRFQRLDVGNLEAAWAWGCDQRHQAPNFFVLPAGGINRLVEQDARFFLSAIGAKSVRRKPWAFGSQLVKGDQIGPTGMVDTDGAFRPPGSLKDHAGATFSGLYPDAVEHVDRCAVFGVGNAVPAIIGPDHMDARLIIRGQ